MSLVVGQTLNVFIEKLTFNGGRGLARSPFGVIFIQGGAPQEEATVKITKLAKNYAEAELVAVLQPGPSRRVAPCPYYARCGGCSLQHLGYEAQIQQKISMLADTLRPLEKASDFALRPFRAAPAEFHYRNRAQFHHLHGQIGFFQRNSLDLVDLERCLIVEESINHRLQEMRKKLAANGLSGDLPARFELHTGQSPVSAGLPIGFFSQINSEQNAFLQQTVLEEFQSSSPGAYEQIWDLYGGAGNLSLPLAQKFPAAPSTCVESSKAAVEFGKKLRDSLNLRHFQFEALPVEVFLKRQTARPRFIILDPPRAGLTKLAREHLLRLSGGSKLIYISCNPSSFVRDALTLIQKSSLRPKWIQGLDMFPQTDHIELISCFE